MNNFDRAIFEKEEVLRLIPQRSPIVMIDAFYGVCETESYSGMTVDADNIFVMNGELREPGLVEHVAQSAAARIGYICLMEQKPVPLGYIGGVKNFNIYELPKVGDELHTTIKVEHEILGVTLISAQTVSADDGTVYSDCEMKIFVGE